MDEIDHRLTDLETNTVESAPKTIVKQVEVYVDQNGTQYDTPQPGTHPEITFQRERVFRRQTVDDAIAEALANQLRFCARDIARRIGHEFALAFGVAKEKGIAIAAASHPRHSGGSLCRRRLAPAACRGVEALSASHAPMLERILSPQRLAIVLGPQAAGPAGGSGTE